MLSSTYDPTPKLWDVVTGRLLRTFTGHSLPVSALSFSPDGSRALSGSFDSTVKLWDAATGQLLHSFEGHTDIVNSVAFSPDGNTVLSGSNDRTAKLWDVKSGKLLHTLPNPVAGCTQFGSAFSTLNRTGDADRRVRTQLTMAHRVDLGPIAHTVGQ